MKLKRIRSHIHDKRKYYLVLRCAIVAVCLFFGWLSLYCRNILWFLLNLLHADLRNAIRIPQLKYVGFARYCRANAIIIVLMVICTATNKHNILIYLYHLRRILLLWLENWVSNLPLTPVYCLECNANCSYSGCVVLYVLIVCIWTK